MNEPLLNDKEIFPTEEIIFSHIGKSKLLWVSLFQSLHDHYSNVSEEWRYYNDGKSWLLKCTLKKKTLFWLSIAKNSFRTTFYFTDRVERAIETSKIPLKWKLQFKNGKRYNKIRGLTITYRTKKDVDYFFILLDIKLKAK